MLLVYLGLFKLTKMSIQRVSLPSDQCCSFFWKVTAKLYIF